mmetsp:Transcript_5062/g.12820  ORF Transcript_5062/g.12820 Transcript_5062/m.12820 type:complete len:377 (-) Transcript_5062:208-1338(-)
MINGTYSTATSSSPLTSSPRPRPRPRRRMRMDRNTTSSSSSARSRTTMGAAMMVIVSAMMVTSSQAFVVPPSTAAFRTKAATAFSTSPSQQQQQQHSQHHPLCAFVADRVDHEAFEEKKRKRDREDETNGRSGGDKNDEKNASQSAAWRPSKNGGFIPNLKAKASSIKILRRVPSTTSRPSSTTTTASTEQITSVDDVDDQEIFPRVQKNQQDDVIVKKKEQQLKIWTVDDIQRYKEVVADEKDAIVVVRFYAPWCRACRAIQSAYRSLPKQYCDDDITTTTTRQRIKFVEVPVTKDNTYLHRGLGVPSLPYGHIYHPTGGLVEEMKISKHHFGNFQQILAEYVDGQCQVEYDEEDEGGAACRRRLRSGSSRRPEP